MTFVAVNVVRALETATKTGTVVMSVGCKVRHGPTEYIGYSICVVCTAQTKVRDILAFRAEAVLAAAVFVSPKTRGIFLSS